MSTDSPKPKLGEFIKTLLASLEEVANRWSSGLFVLTKTIAAMSLLIATMATVIISTQWFIMVYGSGTFVLTLILSSFAFSVFATMTNKNK